jgi:hypothetical protein
LLKKFAPYKPPEEILKLIGATGYAGPMPSNMHNPFLGGAKEPGPVNAPTSGAFADMVARETQQAAPAVAPEAKKPTGKK